VCGGSEHAGGEVQPGGVLGGKEWGEESSDGEEEEEAKASGSEGLGGDETAELYGAEQQGLHLW